MLAALLALPGLESGLRAQAQSCPGGGYDPTPTPVEVTAVPIVVTSTTADYFVLYVLHDLDGETVELPVLVALGEAGTTTLAENIKALPAERYRVEKYLVDDPADVDGDCIDDITELADLGNMNPVNPAAAIDPNHGALAIPDSATFETLSFEDQFATISEYVKFVLIGMDTERPSVYFANTDRHVSHSAFLDAVDIEQDQDGMRGREIVYDPELVVPGGSPGHYWFTFYVRLPFSFVERAHTLLAASMPVLEDNLVS